MTLPYRDRREAGRVLAERLIARGVRADLVLALPRGGVPVAFEVAAALGLPLDVFAVRKLGFPGQEELAVGAIASGGVIVLNEELVRATGLTRRTIDRIAAEESEELARRERLYRGGDGGVSPAGRSVILVDDGLATGASMRAAVAWARGRGAARVVAAAPVSSSAAAAALRAEADAVVCVHETGALRSVGEWYDDFGQVGEDAVAALLARADATSEV